MPERLSSNELIALAEEVVLRQVTVPEKIAPMMTLGLHVRSGINWRTVLHSSASAQKVWIRLEALTIDMERVLAMTSEFKVRAGDIDRALYESIDSSLSWSAVSEALPPEVKRLTAEKGKYQKVLEDNPWVLFLYLLSMSSVVQRLIQVTPKGYKPPQEPKEAV